MKRKRNVGNKKVKKSEKRNRGKSVITKKKAEEKEIMIKKEGKKIKNK